MGKLNSRQSPSRRVAVGTRALVAPFELLEARQFLSASVAPAGLPVASTAGAVYAPAATPALPAPVVVSPGSSTSPGPVLTTLSPTFTWKAETDATFTGYQLNLFNETTGTFVSYQVGKSQTSFTVPAPLAAGDAFVWNLRLVDGTTTGLPGTYLYFQTTPGVALPAPVVVSPGSSIAPGPVLTTLTPTFTWDAVTDATFAGYQLHVINETTGVLVSYAVSKTATSFTLPTALTPGDAYVWNLRLANGSTTGLPGTYLYFQAPAPVLPAPVVVSPGSTTAPGPVLTTLSPTFTWHAVTDATFTGYQLNLENLTTSTFTSYQIGKTATSFTVPTALPAGDTFVWNLRLVDGTASGPPSAYLYFQTPASAVLPSPVVVSPGSSTAPGPVLTTLTPTFSWDAVTGVPFTGYQLHVINLSTDVITSYSIGPTSTSFTLPTPLTAGVQYVWNLRLVNGSATGLPGTYLYFQAPAAVLPAPVVIAPGSTTAPGPVLTTLSPTFTWHAVTDATFTGYQLNLENLTTSTFTSYQIGKTATSFTVPTALPAGDTFVWNLRLVNGDTSGPPSAYLYFQTPPTPVLPAPIVIAPGSTTASGPVLTTLSPTFTWHAVTDATFTGYQLNLENLTTSTFTSYQVGKTATSFTVPTALPAGDTFVWNLRLVNGSTSGPPSAYLYFQTPPPAVLAVPVVLSPGSSTAPGPVLTTLTPTFTWEAVTGVTFTGYQLHVIDLSTDVITSYSIGPTSTSFTLPTPLTAGVKYVWNLRLVNGNTTGLPGTYLYFQAPTAALVAPVVLGPGSTETPGPVVTTTTPTFTWKAVTGVTFDTYQLNLYDETIGKFLSFQISSADTQFTPPAGQLAAGDTFVWNLRLKVGSTTGPESAYLYFQTA